MCCCTYLASTGSTLTSINSLSVVIESSSKFPSHGIQTLGAIFNSPHSFTLHVNSITQSAKPSASLPHTPHCCHFCSQSCHLSTQLRLLSAVQSLSKNVSQTSTSTYFIILHHSIKPCPALLLHLCRLTESDHIYDVILCLTSKSIYSCATSFLTDLLHVIIADLPHLFISLFLMHEIHMCNIDSLYYFKSKDKNLLVLAFLFFMRTKSPNMYYFYCNIQYLIIFLQSFGLFSCCVCCILWF